MNTHAICSLCSLLVPVVALSAPTASDLRLVPFPKEVALAEGGFALPPAGAALVLTLPAGDGLSVAAQAFADGLAPVFPEGRRFTVQTKAPTSAVLWFTLDGGAGPQPPANLPTPPDEGWGDGYAVQVAPSGVVGTAKAPSGLANALRTLTQLLRANCRDGSIPALVIRDWPTLRYRGYQDDMTRGPSSKPSFLLEELDLGAALKMNLFTYYMEQQFTFAKHPLVGLPEDNGGLGPNELKGLVAAAGDRNIHILGCQQSFGHFWNILRHKEYEHLRETPGILDPTNEGTYQLLDDFYSEQAPLLPFGMFNVCCDETDGLGTGPSAQRAAEIGVGGVYAGHLARLHDILKEKYGKRMMMWGDIILRHPENLKQIPADTIMLTWGYGPRPDFTDQIEPFAKSGFEFFVCPGVNGWSRILPDFDSATTNIRNFLRDGAAQGALGTINTTWDDDGENLGGAHWHGFAWGAECAWNGGATTPEDFNRRVGAVVFGEAGDHFGQAVTLLGKACSRPGLGAMMNSRFWQLDTAECPVSEPVARTQAAAILEVVAPAVEHLQALKAEAKAGAHAVETMLFGAQRLQLIAERAVAVLDVAHAAERAVRGDLSVAEARTQALAPLRQLRQRHADLRQRYEVLWNEENEPYALEPVLKRYDALLARYDTMTGRLEETLRVLEANAAATQEAKAAGKQAQLEPLPSLAEVGLAVRELGVRTARPEAVAAEPLDAALPWPAWADARLGLTVRWPEAMPVGVPVPVQVVIPKGAVPDGRVPLLQRVDGAGAGATPATVLCQADRAQDSVLLSFVAARPAGATTERYLLYVAPAGDLQALPAGGVTITPEEGGMLRLQNDRVSLLIGPEGGHIYEWKVLEANGLDLTEPGTRDWTGFADLGGDLRNAPNTLEVLRAGPAVGLVRATSPNGTTKDILLCAGQGWAEVILNVTVGWFWNYDDAAPFAPDSPQPGTFLYSDGFTGAVGPVSANTQAQVRRDNVSWGAKTRADGLTHALLTPDVRTRHVTGPGGGWGGCGLEWSPAASHYVTVGDVVREGLADRLNALAAALSLKDQPRVTLHGIEARP
jgi:hypothetical protein